VTVSDGDVPEALLTTRKVAISVIRETSRGTLDVPEAVAAACEVKMRFWLPMVVVL
jgi:hypothetical protein